MRSGVNDARALAPLARLSRARSVVVAREAVGAPRASAPSSSGATNSAASPQISRRLGMSPSTSAQPRSAASSTESPKGS